jgi:iron complex outermembrane receptor protein
MSRLIATRCKLTASVACLLVAPAVFAQERAETRAVPEELVVTGIRQQYRGDVPLKELPQSVQVISSEMLADVGVTRLDAALDLASGINRQNNFGGMWDAFSVRGFSGDENLPSGVLVNGFNAGRGFGGPRDASNVERIEVLKGPNSALFGRGEPGGTVSITTKKPQFDTQGSFTISAGSFKTVRAEGDITGPITDSIAVRVNGAYNNSDNFRDVLSNTRYTVTPSVLINFSDKTKLSYELEYINLRTPMDRGVVAINGQLGLVPRTRFFGEPGDGRTKVTALGHQLQFQHDFAKGWSALLGFGYRDTSLSGFSSDPEITPARQLLYTGSTLMSRQRRFRDYDTRNLVARSEISGKLYTGSLVHHLLIGADYDEFDIDQVQTRFRPPLATAQQGGAFGNTINIFNPVYGSQPAPGPFRDLVEKQRSWGIYFQDQIDVTDQLKVRLGGRYDEFKPRLFFRANDFAAAVGSTPPVKFTRFSPQAGVVYEFSPMFSLYASYGEGFRPNSGTNVASVPFEPETTRAYEVGAKFATADERISGTIALFDIKKSNVLTTDPLNPGFALALGSARSKGVEFDLNGELPGEFRIWLSYAYLDAEVGEDARDPSFNTPILKGDPLLNIPKHTANVLLTRDFKIGDDTLMIGGGVNYVSSRLGEVADKSFRLPSYTLVKLLASYELSDQFKIAAEVDNLLDKHYYPSSFSRLWVTPGTPRAFTVRGTYKF